MGLSFDDLYARHFDFVWRTLRAQGVSEAQVDDAVQDVFLVVHRRLEEFRPDSPGGSARAWIFQIVLRVASDYRRSFRRKGGALPLDESLAPDTLASPLERAAMSEAARTLQCFLDEIDQDKRDVFILAELEQMTAPEIADTLGVNINTVYSRLKTARDRFVEAVRRNRRRDPGGRDE